MFCLPVEGPIVGAGSWGGGGVSGGFRRLDKRGAVIQSLRKRGGSFKKIFSAPVWTKNKTGGAGGHGRAPPLDPPLVGCYNQQFTVVN